MPLCKSEFLQDVTIVVGLRSKGLRYGLADFRCFVREEELEEESCEYLVFETDFYDGGEMIFRFSGTKELALWYGRTAGIPGHFSWRFLVSIEKLSAVKIVSKMKETFGLAFDSYHHPHKVEQIAKAWGYDGDLDLSGLPTRIQND